ncbi:hypothetical protein B5M06_03255 [Comamonas kerstersii]|uniref:Uncharacterized protein n=1 Tax=Comamonas kerstersii TaxID=225992 RepID=A0A1V0BBW5_9BURK|nr:hypothetical protein B5M06_03255 [Comamonas kerstersii]
MTVSSPFLDVHALFALVQIYRSWRCNPPAGFLSLLICSEIQHPILHALADKKEKKLDPDHPLAFTPSPLGEGRDGGRALP